MTERMVNAAGRQIHVTSRGDGRPEVVLVSGIGGLSVFWRLVEPGIAAFTRVHAYDRPGYLRSDAPPVDAALTAGRAADELFLLLQRLEAVPPFVFVGHSFGGFIIRLFAARHPEQVAGIVLLDADHEDEWTDKYPDEHRKGLRLVGQMMKLMSRLSYLGIPQLMVRLRKPEPVRRLPAEAQRLALDGFGRRTLATISREFDALESSAAEVQKEARHLGQIPLVVVRRGQPGPVAPGVRPEQAEKLERLAIGSQEALARLSSQGELRVAGQSGHDLHLEQPELVVEAVRSVVERIRKMNDSLSKGSGRPSAS